MSKGRRQRRGGGPAPGRRCLDRQRQVGGDPRSARTATSARSSTACCCRRPTRTSAAVELDQFPSDVIPEPAGQQDLHARPAGQRLGWRRQRGAEGRARRAAVPALEGRHRLQQQLHRPRRLPDLRRRRQCARSARRGRERNVQTARRELGRRRRCQHRPGPARVQGLGVGRLLVRRRRRLARRVVSSTASTTATTRTSRVSTTRTGRCAPAIR